MTDVGEPLRALLQSDTLTEPTRRALTERVNWRPGPPSVLSAEQLAVLEAVAARLVPLDGVEGAPELNLAARWEAQLAEGKGDGWRYADMPADVDAARLGLDALGQGGFLDADAAGRDAHLRKVQAGEVEGWPVDPARWFEEVLAALVQLAYGHPAVQQSIGYDGMADAHGFQDIDDHRAGSRHATSR